VTVSIRKFRIIVLESNTELTIRFDSKFEIFTQHYMLYVCTDYCKDLTQRTAMLCTVRTLRYSQVVLAALVNRQLEVARYIHWTGIHCFCVIVGFNVTCRLDFCICNRGASIIGRLSASLQTIGIGHFTIGISRLSADADNRPIICFSKQNNKNAFNCSSYWWQWCN